MIELVPNASQKVVQMITQKVGVTALSNSTAFGFYEEGELIGGVAFYEYRMQDIVFSGYMDKGGSFTKQMFRKLYYYPFIQLGCHRVTAYTEVDNREANLFLRRMGFTKEGRIREVSDSLKDINVYGMLKRECKWI